ncbi:MAG: hypothetical protein GVY12_04635 [Bacteroidetes bacterium]|jgi:hypothetical protein|nr:hypothetical protein [Bacteroidota bacterium]
MRQAVLLLLWLYLLVPSSAAQDLSLIGTDQASPVLQAQPATGEISVDGALDEPAWAEAAAATDFVQFEPDEGAAPSQRTEVRILYGESGLYIGAMLYDDEPGRIQNRLTRRDNRNQADWFDVSIDSRLDRQTAYTFAVNAAGVQRDGLTQTGTDTAWDAIWDSAVQITDEGWSVEMHIPYSMLRFSRGASQRWGLQFERRIPRTGERLEWAFTPRTERGGRPVAEYGLLVRLDDVRPSRNIQVFPYLVTQVDTREGEESGELQTDERFDAGADVQIGLGPNITLNATINPDFGQVQSDPATLNLTAFETFFPERRPFFTEGSQFFNFDQQGGSLLNTRRIGSAAPIIGATKVTGRTPGGLSFGGLAALEGDAFSPQRAYGVGSLQQDIGTYSNVGGMVTAFEGPRGGIDHRSVTGGVDWDFRLSGNTYQIRGHASFSYRNPLDAPGRSPSTGVSASTRLARVQGATTYRIRGSILDDQFNPNDLGRLRQNNYLRVRARVDHEFNGGQSFGAFQRARARFSLGQSWTYDEQLSRGIGYFARTTWTFRNFSQIRLWTSGDYLAGGYDVFETRGEGPRARPREFDVGLNVRSDTRRSWQVSPRVSTSFRQGDGVGYAVGLGSSWDANQYLSFSASTSYERTDDFVEWASNETVIRQDEAWVFEGDEAREVNGPLASLDALFAPRLAGPGQAILPIYGARNTRTLDVELSADVTLSPALSVELFGQLFAARGQYHGFQILQTRDRLASFEAYPRRHDFAMSSFIANTVLRWEYQPGSELFVVWSQSRRQNLDDPFFFDERSTSPFEPSTMDRMEDTFGIFPNNTFSVKLRYAITS